MKRSTSWIAVLPSLVIPLCLGMTMYLGLSYLIAHDYITHQLLLRYITGHPISQVTVAMFLIGIASLAMIGKDIVEQFWTERKITFETRPAGDPSQDSSDNLQVESHQETSPDASANATAPVPTETIPGVSKRANVFRDTLHQMPAWIQEHYLWQRLVAALSHLQRTDSVASVEDELKYLSDLDLDRQQQRYSLVRILIWATPMLGFLGTVLGISEALGGISVGPENNFQHMMDGLRGSLYVAFDTTALALTLSMVLMFIQFLADRFESQLLTLVDQRARSEVARSFDLTTSNPEMQKFTDDFLELTERSVGRQAEIWKQTIMAAEKAWSASLTQSNELVQTNLSDALDDNVANLAHYLGQAISKADEAMTNRLQQWQVTLSSNARVMSEHQKQLAEQASHLEGLMEANRGTEVFQEAVDQNRLAADATRQLKTTIEALRESVQALHDSSLAAVQDARNHLMEASNVQHRDPNLDWSEQLSETIQTRDLLNTLPESQQDRPEPSVAFVARTDAATDTVVAAERDAVPSSSRSTRASKVTPSESKSAEVTFEQATISDSGVAAKLADVSHPPKVAAEDARTEAIELATEVATEASEAEVILKFPSPEELAAKKNQVRSASHRASKFLAHRRQRAA